MLKLVYLYPSTHSDVLFRFSRKVNFKIIEC